MGFVTLLLICMGAFVYWIRFVWHWQHCNPIILPILINWSGIFERYNVERVPIQINDNIKLHILWVRRKCPWIK